MVCNKYTGFGFLSAIALLAGCVSTAPSLSGDTCGASRFQNFTGQPVSALADKVLRVGLKDGISFYGESIIPAHTRPSTTLGSIAYKNKFDVAPKSRIIVVYDDKNGILPYQGSDPKAKFIGAVENTVTQVACGRR